VAGSLIIDEARRVAVLRFSGTITENDVHTIARAAVDDPRVTPNFDRLIDFTEAVDIQVTGAGIRTIADLARDVPVGRRAIIAPDLLSFGLARMFEQNLRMPEGHSGVFKDRASALEFLGLDPETSWPEA
jgi:hypothetical protein